MRNEKETLTEKPDIKSGNEISDLVGNACL